MMTVTDDMLDRIPAMSLALEAISLALAARSAGRLVSPPRHHTQFAPHGDLVFTIGGTTGDGARVGFRAYDTFGDESADQLVAVWAPEERSLVGIAVGTKVGEIRTGAIGGIAIGHMSAADADTVGIIGSGRQAATQLEAAACVRRLRRVRIFSRNKTNRDGFATAMSRRLELQIEPVDTARSAVQEADIVICATDSATPVIDPVWIKPGAHINTVGPKTQAAHELPPSIAALASTIATDAPEQTCFYRSPFFLDEAMAGRSLIDLADIVAGRLPGRESAEETTLFCSAGLAGTEVLVAAKLMEALATAS